MPGPNCDFVQISTASLRGVAGMPDERRPSSALTYGFAHKMGSLFSVSTGTVLRSFPWTYGQGRQSTISRQALLLTFLYQRFRPSH